MDDAELKAKAAAKLLGVKLEPSAMGGAFEGMIFVELPPGWRFRARGTEQASMPRSTHLQNYERVLYWIERLVRE